MKIIPLTKGYESLIDDEDFEKVSKFKWHIFITRGKHNVYAVFTDHSKSGDKTIRMHRMILNAKKNDQVDHIDGNGLNNQKFNLRICTNSQNQANKSFNKNNSTGFKGVTYRENEDRYIAQITYNRKNYYLGIYKSPISAARAYNRAAKKYFKEFSKLNKI